MPKELFFSIPPSKQKRVLDCALEEFSVQEYHDASINRMIQAAEISRGSFYLYFENKEDLFFYLFEEILREEQTAFFADGSQEFPSDPLRFHQMMFRFNLSMLGNPTYRDFFQNLFLAMDYRFGLRYRELIEKSRLALLARLGIQDRQEAARISETLEVLGLITMDLLSLKAMDGLPDEEIWQRYHAKLGLLGLEQL